jgi:hypothetical protein
MLSLVEATVVGLYSISKAFRPEFDALGAPERAQDRDRTVSGLHSAVFGSRLRFSRMLPAVDSKLYNSDCVEAA